MPRIYLKKMEPCMHACRFPVPVFLFSFACLSFYMRDRVPDYVIYAPIPFLPLVLFFFTKNNFLKDQH